MKSPFECFVCGHRAETIDVVGRLESVKVMTIDQLEQVLVMKFVQKTVRTAAERRLRKLIKIRVQTRSRIFGICFTAAQNAALSAAERAPRWDLDPPQRESYYNDTEYAFGLRDYADKLIAANKE